MPAEHAVRRADGTIGLRQGYYCGTCGKPTSMMGHHGSCEPNPDLVRELDLVNAAVRSGREYITF